LFIVHFNLTEGWIGKIYEEYIETYMQENGPEVITIEDKGKR
jgi:hypothetical protein